MSDTSRELAACRILGSSAAKPPERAIFCQLSVLNFGESDEQKTCRTAGNSGSQWRAQHLLWYLPPRTIGLDIGMDF